MSRRRTGGRPFPADRPGPGWPSAKRTGGLGEVPKNNMIFLSHFRHNLDDYGFLHFAPRSVTIDLGSNEVRPETVA